MVYLVSGMLHFVTRIVYLSVYFSLFFQFFVEAGAVRVMEGAKYILYLGCWCILYLGLCILYLWTVFCIVFQLFAAAGAVSGSWKEKGHARDARC